MKRPALYILAPFCLGIFAATSLRIPLIVAFVLAATLAIVSFAAGSRRTLSHTCLYLALFFLGAAFLRNAEAIRPDDISRLASDAPRRVFVKGVVTGDPVIERTRFGTWRASFYFRADAVRQGRSGGFRAATGLVDTRVYTKERLAFAYGDEVILEGALARPAGLRNPGAFDYSKYLAMRDVYSSLKAGDRDFVEVIAGGPANPVARSAYRLRAAVRKVLDTYLSGPDNAFVKAILIGERSALSDELNDDFIRTGTVHILSISGLHVALIAALVLAVFGFAGAPRGVSLVLTMGVLVFYVFVAGSSAPIVRSVIMFFLVAGAYLLGRQSDAVNSLAAAAFIILLRSPKALFDPGFQLSFVSVASMVILGPKIASALGAGMIGRTGARAKALRYLAAGVSASVAAWIGTMPIVLAYFNTVSLVSIAANLVIVPLSFASMGLSIALVAAAPFSAPLAASCAFGVSAVNALLFSVNRALACIPGGSFRMASLGAGYILAYYALVCAWAASPAAPEAASEERRRLRTRRSAALIASLAVLNLLAWRDCFAYALDRSALRVTFLDVGLGDAAFIEFPGGGNMLIDAGPGGGEGLDAGRSVIAPYLWNKGVYRLDTVVISHAHQDHVGGLPYLLKNFGSGVVADGGVVSPTAAGDSCLRALRSSGARRVRIGAGDVLRLPGGARFFVVSPDKDADYSDENEGSVVGKLVCGGASVLFCGDATSAAMERAAGRYGNFLRSDIMKAPHHGGSVGDLSIAKVFFDTVDPGIAVISTSRDRRYDWRNGKIATYLLSMCYDTSRDGAVIITFSDKGRQIRTLPH